MERELGHVQEALMFRRALVTLAVLATFIAAARAEQPPTLTIVNQAGDNATVKVVGPSTGQIGIASGGRQTVIVSGGSYELRIRYCGATGCRYTRTDSFTVTDTRDRVSRTMVTLHSSTGNLSEKPIAPSDF
jgi:hypothetical protein